MRMRLSATLEFSNVLKKNNLKNFFFYLASNVDWGPPTFLEEASLLFICSPSHTLPPWRLPFSLDSGLLTEKRGIELRNALIRLFPDTALSLPCLLAPRFIFESHTMKKLRINTEGVFSVSRTYVFRLRFQGRHPVPMVTVIGQCLRLEWSFGRNAWSYYGNISGKLARVMSKNHSP